MADYDGILIADKTGVVPVWCFPHSTVQKHGGTYSIRLLPGREYPPIWAACNAGSRIVSAWVYAPSGGVCQMKVVDPATLEVMGRDENASSGEWEQLSIAFTATKKCYWIILGNYTPAYVPGDLRAGYFDDLAVA